MSKDRQKKFKTVWSRINVRTIDGMIVNGRVNIAAKDRVSDLFTNTKDPFLVMTDVRLPEGGARTLFVNKRHVVWVEPEE
jgi:hypothetical protein